MNTIWMTWLLAGQLTAPTAAPSHLPIAPARTSGTVVQRMHRPPVGQPSQALAQGDPRRQTDPARPPQPVANHTGQAAGGQPDVATPPAPHSDKDQARPAWMVEKKAEPVLGESLDLSGLAFRMFMGTIGVLAAAAASIFLGRQWLDQRRPAEPLGQQIRVVETKTLSSRASLQLVDAAGQMVLVGVDSHGIKGMVRLTGAFEDVWQQATDDATESDANHVHSPVV